MGPCIELFVLGTGAGATAVYKEESSSSYVIVIDGLPELLLDAVRQRPVALLREHGVDGAVVVRACPRRGCHTLPLQSLRIACMCPAAIGTWPWRCRVLAPSLPACGSLVACPTRSLSPTTTATMQVRSGCCKLAHSCCLYWNAAQRCRGP